VFHLFAPEFLLEEFNKYENDILEKTSREPDDFQQYYELLTRKIVFIPLDELVPFLNASREISPDPKDALYFALALKLDAKIWSNDKRLKNQEKIQVLSTSEILQK